jgi:uncharacterized protein DUF4062
MARPRIFISSTYYDLKHLRSSLENFVESLGFDAILSEKGDIAYAPDTPLDESCYREVGNADIYVLIIGGRYGSEKSETRTNIPKSFYDRYDSITRGEYKSAASKDIPIYILIERTVYSDFETYLRNKNQKNVTYAHVDSVNIFSLVEDILAQPRNNPIQQFDRYSDIETWLKEQWAGLFRELLNRMSGQRQLSSLASQVAGLAEINKTLKAYLEEVVSKIAPDESARIIRTEAKRLEDARRLAIFEGNPLINYLRSRFSIHPKRIMEAVLKAQSVETFQAMLLRDVKSGRQQDFQELFQHSAPAVQRDLIALREMLQQPMVPEAARAVRPKAKDTERRKANKSPRRTA